MESLKLKSEQLKTICNIEDLNFETTSELSSKKGIIGRERGVKSLEFGLKVNKKGYNIYLSGFSGTGRSSCANYVTEKFAKTMNTPLDWVYVFNFDNPDKPKALSLETGSGKQFKDDIKKSIDSLKEEIPKIFSGSEYETQKSEIYTSYQRKNQEIIKQLNEIAKKHGFIFRETEQGLVTAPLNEDGEQMSQEEYENLDSDSIHEIREKSEKLNIETIDLFNELRNIENQAREDIKKLDEKIVYDAINYYIKALLKRYGHRKELVDYINSIEKDIIKNIRKFKNPNGSKSKNPQAMLMAQMGPKVDFFQRYSVNLFVDNSKKTSAPIINETSPSFYNLLGSIEYKNEMGVLRTDFKQIKSGSLHLANGGFLIIQAKDLLTEPFAWQILKRTLKTGEINIENLGKQMGHVVTSSIKPEPIPIDLKVILVGDSYTYSLLYNYDEDFRKLFKVMADFDIEMERNKEHIIKMGEFISNHCEENNMLDFDKYAVARIVEYSSRLADHQNKLSTRFNKIVEVLYEADTWANLEESDIVRKSHVDKAIEEKIYRNSKYEEKLNEMFKEGSLLLDVDGEKIGQINGLAVMGTGEHSFGRPSRITVSTYQGKPGILSIEREVRKSGSIHDKGVLILSGYLGEKFAKKNPMTLGVSVSFEQNYSVIDGDSASSTELYAVLSSISQIPLKQGIAVTGSVNQKGEIQPIGGVNEKIEGFYDICKLKGLTGKQGVIIPIQNIKNLMLKQEVIDAVKANEFHIYAISCVEEGIEILTDVKSGKLIDGKYEEGSVYEKVQSVLDEIHNKRLSEIKEDKKDK